MKKERVKRKKKSTKKKEKFLYDKIDYDQWDVMEYLHYNMGIYKPMKLTSRDIGSHLDQRPEKIKKILDSLKKKKLITQKKQFLTEYGKKVKLSYERKYEPDP